MLFATPADLDAPCFLSPAATGITASLPEGPVTLTHIKGNNAFALKPSGNLCRIDEARSRLHAKLMRYRRRIDSGIRDVLALFGRRQTR